MDNGLIGWIPESFSLQLIAAIIIFILPGFCVLAFATLIPFMIWGEFWGRVINDSNSRNYKNWKKSHILFLTLTICVAATMYVVWVRWLWSFSDGDQTWLSDILYGKGNWR